MATKAKALAVINDDVLRLITANQHDKEQMAAIVDMLARAIAMGAVLGGNRHPQVINMLLEGTTHHIFKLAAEMLAEFDKRLGPNRG